MEYTLLVIEDDGDTSEMLRVYFEAQGYHVVTALTCLLYTSPSPRDA